MADKKKIDEKLAELCASIKEFSSLTDRTKAIEDLAKRMGSIGKEHLSEAKEEMETLCKGVLKSLKEANAVPEKLEAATKQLNGKANECVGQIDGELAAMEARTKTCVKDLTQTVAAIDKSVAVAAKTIDAKVFAIEDASPFQGFNNFKEDVENRIVELEEKITGIVKSQTALAQSVKEVAASVKTVIAMVEKIPTKRGIFG